MKHVYTYELGKKQCPEVWCSKRRLGQNRSTFRVMRATSAKFGLHVGNKNFNTQNEE